MAKSTRPAESSKKQPRGKPFQPGQSGNPGGRKPKTAEERTLEAMCRDRTQDALAVLLQIMESGEQERNRITAAMAVIDRGHGKARESLELSGGVTLSIADQIKQAHAARGK